MHDKTTEIFKNAPIPKAVILNVIPSVIGMVMVLIYNLADTFFIGQTKDAYMVAAVSIATPAFLFFMAVGMLFGVGGTSLISRMLGEGKKDAAKHASSFCFWSGAITGIVGMVLIWLFLDPICRMLGSSKDTITYVKQYIEIVAFGVPFLIIGNSFSNIIRSEGNANKAMIGMVLGNLANIILDPIMILGFGWNVVGAAVATVIGNIVAASFYIFHMCSKNSLLSIKIRDYSVTGHIATGVFAIGIPAAFNSILMTVSNILVNNLMTTHGDMAVAGLGVSMKVNMIVVILLIGVGTGIQPLLGYCYGARDRDRFKGVLKFSIGLALLLSILMTIVCYAFAGPMVRAFLTDQEAYQFGMQFARTLIISGPIMGILFVLINTIQAMGAAGPSLILSISRQGIVYIPVLFSFHLIFNNARMLVAAQPVADYMAVTLAMILYFVAYKRYFKVME